MRFWKSFLGLALVATVFTTGAALAQTIGTVDADKIISNYTKAQDVEADLKVKEAEIQKFIAEAQKKIKAASTPVEKSNLEKQLGEEFKQKQIDYRQLTIDESKKINQDIISAIESVAKKMNIELVLAKGAVFIGGDDITESVLKELNGK